MTVYETDIPGVGRKFEVELADGQRAVVIHHHDGRRELFRRASPEADSEQVFDLSDAQARTLGSILSGAHFESVAAGDLSVPLGDAIIEWVEVPSDSSLVGLTLADANVRTETGVSVIAIQRGRETVANPGADTSVDAGDIIVGLGSRQEHAALDALVAGEDDSSSADSRPDSTADES
jgi:TrkA domain protein